MTALVLAFIATCWLTLAAVAAHLLIRRHRPPPNVSAPRAD